MQSTRHRFVDRVCIEVPWQGDVLGAVVCIVLDGVWKLGWDLAGQESPFQGNVRGCSVTQTAYIALR